MKLRNLITNHKFLGTCDCPIGLVLILDETWIGRLWEAEAQRQWLSSLEKEGSCGFCRCTKQVFTAHTKLTLSLATYSSMLNLWSLLGSPRGGGLPFSNLKSCQEIGLRKTSDQMFLPSQNISCTSDAILFLEGSRVHNWTGELVLGNVTDWWQMTCHYNNSVNVFCQH